MYHFLRYDLSPSIEVSKYCMYEGSLVASKVLYKEVVKCHSTSRVRHRREMNVTSL